jgi:Uma2 family endonuclease
MSVAMEDFPRRHRITVDEYHRMGETGLLAPDARVELIEGEIVDMPPIGNPHMAAVSRLTRLLVMTVGDRGIVQCQGGIRLGNYSEPQPDFAIVKPREDFYQHQPRWAVDTLLAIEVSDSSLRYDLRTKMPLYARHGVPELWVLDLSGRQLHAFREPTDTGYANVVVTRNPGKQAMQGLPGVEIDLSGVFGVDGRAPPDVDA